MTAMSCPYLKEVVMLSCDACPVKKMLPLERLASANPCLGHFHECAFFQDLTLQLAVRESGPATDSRLVATAGKDGR